LYLEAELIRQDRQISYLVLDLNELTQNPDYLAFLARSNPGFNLDLPGTDWSTPERSKVTVMRFLQQLSQTYEIYCLPPPPLTDLVAEYCSFEPHGLVCRLAPYSANSAFADPWADSVVMENEEFWRRFENQLLPVLQARLRASQPAANASPAREYLHYLGWPPSPGPEAAETAAGYAAALNDWGVALQRLGRFSEAASCFRTALDLNPQNPAAQINQKFNSGYLTNRVVTMQKPLEVARSVTEFRDWEHVLRAGLVDEPNFCNLLGTVMEANNLFRPAIAEYERVLALSPARTDTQLSLARLFLECHDLTNALAETDRILLNSPANQAALNLRAQALMQQQAFDRALIPLTTLLADQPANPSLRLSRAIALYKTGRLAAAREDYQAALQLGGHPFQAYLGLAEIARQSNEAAVAITNYELFIRYAPADTLELEEAQNHLKELKAAGAQ
jgi:tetratricopeptide (TPR) repeat protein